MLCNFFHAQERRLPDIAVSSADDGRFVRDILCGSQNNVKYNVQRGFFFCSFEYYKSKSSKNEVFKDEAVTFI